MVQAERMILMKGEVYPLAMSCKQCLLTRTKKYNSGGRVVSNLSKACKVPQ